MDSYEIEYLTDYQEQLLDRELQHNMKVQYEHKATRDREAKDRLLVLRKVQERNTKSSTRN